LVCDIGIYLTYYLTNQMNLFYEMEVIWFLHGTYPSYVNSSVRKQVSIFQTVKCYRSRNLFLKKKHIIPLRLKFVCVAILAKIRRKKTL